MGITEWSPLPFDAERVLLGAETDARGSVEVLRPATDVLVCRARGHFTVEHARAMTRLMRPVDAGEDNVALFLDWGLLEGYDTDARKFATEWAIANRRKFQSASVLTRSRFVSMGVSAASALLALVGIPLVSTSHRSEFEQQLRKRIERS